MKGKNFLVSKEFHFDAVHSLPNYHGKCERLHGHRWRVRVTVTASLDEATGISMDFKEIERIVRKETIENLDHAYLNEILEHPSAENLALYFLESLKEKLPLYSIGIWETPSNKVTFFCKD